MVLLTALSLLNAHAQSAGGAPDAPPPDAAGVVFPRSWPQIAWPQGVGTDAVVVLELTSDASGRIVEVEVVSGGPGRLITAARKAVLGLVLVGEDGLPAAGIWRWRASFDDAVSETFDVVDRTPWRPREVGGRVADVPAGTWRLGGGDIEQMAGAGADVGRALQALPGVQAPRLRSTGLSLHAIGPSEVMWSVEGVPLASPRSVGTVFTRVPQLAVEAVDVRMAAVPADVPGVLAGQVDVTLVDPDDNELDGTVELSPALFQAEIATPLGRRDRGNAVLVGVRRSWLEPTLGLLDTVGAGQPWSFRTSDAVFRLRLEPGSSHRVDLIALGGSARNAGAADESPVDTTNTALGLLRHRWRVAPGVLLEQRLAATREVQDITSEQEARRDRRTRPGFRSMAVLGRPENAVDGVLGVEIARTDLVGEGTLLDPRVAQPWTRVAWRRLEPPRFDLDTRTGWTETAGFGQARFRRGPFFAELGLRTSHFAWIDAEDEDAGALAWVGTASVGAELPTGTRLTALVARGRQRPRDPLSLDPIPSLKAFDLPRSWHGMVGVHQRLGEVGLARLDLWGRRMAGLATWEVGEDPARTRFTGTERAAGTDLLVAARWERWQGGGTVSLASARRVGPGGTVRPDVLVPWSVQVHGGWRPEGEAGWRLEGRVQVRAGVEQVPLIAAVEDGEVTYDADYSAVERLPPQARLAARASRRFVLADRVSLTFWAEMLFSLGPVGEGLVGGGVDEQGALIPPDVVAIRDPVWLPWVGVRARF